LALHWQPNVRRKSTDAFFGSGPEAPSSADTPQSLMLSNFACACSLAGMKCLRYVQTGETPLSASELIETDTGSSTSHTSLGKAHGTSPSPRSLLQGSAAGATTVATMASPKG